MVSMPFPPPPAAPAHGYRGEPTPAPRADRPRGLTVAISREAGARGGSIARGVGERLGWQVFDQDLLGYLAQNEAARGDLLADLPPGALAWADRRCEQLARERRLFAGTDLSDVVRLMLAVAARGEVVIVGRGAGFLLPPETTLNVRVVAPLPQRVAFVAQQMRLSETEAIGEVANRDRVRSALHTAVTAHDPADLTQYDLVVNSGRLGQSAIAELIAAAVKAKHLPDDPSAEEPTG